MVCVKTHLYKEKRKKKTNAGLLERYIGMKAKILGTKRDNGEHFIGMPQDT